MDAPQGYRQLPAKVKRLRHNGPRPDPTAPAAGPGPHIPKLPGSPIPSERYAHGMRNGGDRVPSGTSGRRHRATGPEAPARTGGNGGASLFTPAYRASHAASGTYPVSSGLADADQDRADQNRADQDRADQDRSDQDRAEADRTDQDRTDQDRNGMADRSATGYDRAEPDRPRGGSSWPAEDQPAADYGASDPGYDPDAGYGPSASYEQSAGYSPSPGYGPSAQDRSGAGYSWAGDDLTSSGHSWSRPDLGQERAAERPPSNAVRGFPPDPGDPLPVYPPGPFAAWNRGAPVDDVGRAVAIARPADDADSSRQLSVATITPTEFDTDYSIPAIKDPVLRADRSGSGSGSGRELSSPPNASRGRPVGSHSGRAAGSRSRTTGSRSQAAYRPDSGRADSGRTDSGRADSGRVGTHARKQPVRLAIGAAVAIIVAVTVVLVISSTGGGKLTASHPAADRSSPRTPAASAPARTPPPGRWAYIGTQATDPQPLTTSELYPLSFVEAGVLYKRTVATKSGNCIGGIIGQSLQAGVRQSGCKLVARASYLSRAVKMMATIGVLDLKSFAAASKAALAAGHFDFVAQLPAKTGPTSQLGSGTGIEAALVKGHYLILAWAEFQRLHAPKTSAQRQQLDGFITLLVRQTVNVSLTNRMVDGAPLPSG